MTKKKLLEMLKNGVENWKDHDEYKKNFEKLVESLRVEAEG